MIIKELNKEEYAGKKFTAIYRTSGYYDIQKMNEGFSFKWVAFDEEKEMTFSDCFYNDWLNHPIAYGAFEGDHLLGYVEGALETWNNRYRISNICIFEHHLRHTGIGTKLIEVILEDARKSGARMAVLETWTSNENAIAFYRKYGFDVIGFDLYAYTNEDPQRHMVRIEMGKVL